MDEGQIRQRAALARRLQDDEAFRLVLSEITDQATGLFLNPASTAETLAVAHERVRAVHTVRAALKAMVDDENVLKKRNEKAQHRGND